MEELRNIVSDLLAEFVKDVQTNAMQQRKHVTGRTVRSMERRVTASEGAVRGEMWAAPYIWTLDTGSAPARRRGTDAERESFIQSLTEWCRAKSLPMGGLTQDKYRAFAKFLKWYIQKHGSWLYRNPSQQHKVIAPAIEELDNNLTRRINAAFTDIISKASTHKTIII